MGDPEGPKRTPSAMFLAVGGDKQLLTDAKGRALVQISAYIERKRKFGSIQCSDEIAEEIQRYVSLMVYQECANVGIEGLQNSINHAVEDVDPSIHERPTLPMCPTCGHAIARVSMRPKP